MQLSIRKNAFLKGSIRLGLHYKMWRTEDIDQLIDEVLK
jgi:hypothetical protein